MRDARGRRPGGLEELHVGFGGEAEPSPAVEGDAAAVPAADSAVARRGLVTQLVMAPAHDLQLAHAVLAAGVDVDHPGCRVPDLAHQRGALGVAVIEGDRPEIEIGGHQVLRLAGVLDGRRPSSRALASSAARSNSALTIEGQAARAGTAMSLAWNFRARISAITSLTLGGRMIGARPGASRSACAPRDAPAPLRRNRFIAFMRAAPSCRRAGPRGA